jgi:glyoxylase-like metal-dependent hydrolase (beta-lactamase superfamily II)
LGAGIKENAERRASMKARIDQVTSPGVRAAEGTGHERESNAWIVGDDEEVIVVDPGSDSAAVLAAASGREIIAVICTHGHANHVAAALDVAARDEAPVALHPKDLLPWREAHGRSDPEIEMEDGGVFEVSDVKLEVIHAPGHSPGSVLLYCEDLGVVFSGDVLLAGGPGLHAGDFPNFSAQLSAIGEHILTLPGQTRVLPGHGEEILVAAAEKRFDSWVAAGPRPLAAGEPD